MIVKRNPNNPILKPNREHSWEAEAVFNGCPVKRGSKTHLVYRAQSAAHYHTAAETKMVISDIGIADSHDGVNFENRRRLIIPEEEWERFGVEDPRVTEIDGKYYIFYTALSTYPFSASGIKTAVAVTRDLENIDEKHLVTPFNSKGMALFPRKIGGKYWGVLTIHTDMPPAKICVVPFEKEPDIWSESHWKAWYRDFEDWELPLTRYPVDQVEVGAPPIETEYGWLLIYSYIRNYFSQNSLFTVEAVLLAKDNPREIIARTEMPIMTPEEYYEKIGLVPNIVFPSGALVESNWINLYYGAADTTVCLAQIEKDSLLDLMRQSQKRVVKLKRSKTNPILAPTKNEWESQAVFNPGAILLDGKVHLLYRAMSTDNTSVFGYASSEDGINIDERLDKPVYTPRADFEMKSKANCFSGCEDPRLTLLGEKIYMCYTAFNGHNVPRVALTSINKTDFLERKWHWKDPVLISPPELDDKDAFIFPEKVNGAYMIIHRSGGDIDYGFADNLAFDGKRWVEEYSWIRPRTGRWDSKKVGAAAPPVKTSDGWVFLYHGVSDSGKYRVGAVLLDLENPTKILARSDNPIMEPEHDYEKTGIVPNVVFPCGNVLIKDTLFVYYGGADRVVGVAAVKIDELLGVLALCRVG